MVREEEVAEAEVGLEVVVLDLVAAVVLIGVIGESGK
jgi:hypothetical protein